MGANGTKESVKKSGVPNIITAEEEHHIKVSFQSIPEPKVPNLKEKWNGKLDRQLENHVFNYLSKSKTKTTFARNDFELLYGHLVHGTIDDKVTMLFNMLMNFCHTTPMHKSTLLEYLEGLIKTYMHMFTTSGWRTGSGDDVHRLSETLCADLPSDIEYDKLYSWIASTPNFTSIQSSVFGKLFELKVSAPSLLPKCDKKNIVSILDMTSVMFINTALPAALRNEWRMLFSTSSHGESFSKFLGLVMNKGPTVLILKDKDGYVFGGFAPHSWLLGPNFIGDDTSFLFRVKPTMNVYTSTQYNDHYQYLNTQQETMPNGLGMGGQFGYWGLWIDAEYGTGHSSESCTTYRHCKTLSASKNFAIDHLEVWAVGPLPVVEDDGPQRSILDTNSEAKAILEMVGKHAHSDGLREPEPDDS